MRYVRLLGTKTWLFAAIAMLLVLALACGAADTPTPIVIEKEVIKEVEVVKEVEVIKEVIVEREVQVFEAKPELAEGVPAYVALGNYGGVVPMSTFGEPTKIDPHQATSMTEASFVGNQWNNLVQFNPENRSEIIGELVKSWDLSADGLSYTFKMVDNATWWDGKRVTAQDVKFSIDRMAEGKTQGKRRSRVGRISDYVKSVEVVDDDTFKFNLLFTGAGALFPFLAVEYMKILPKHIVENLDLGDPERQFLPGEVIGSGAFKFVKWTKGISWELEKVDNYWKTGRPFWNGFSQTNLRDPQRLIAALRAEQVLMGSHGWQGLSMKDYIALSKELKDTWTFNFLPPVGGVGFMINFNKKPMSDWRVRKAVYLAVDRKAMLDGWVFGQGREGAAFVPGTWMAAPDEEMWTWPGHRYVDATGNPVARPYDSPVPVFKDPRDIEEAKRLLADAGYPDGVEMNIIVGDPTVEGAIIIGKAFKEVGITLKQDYPEGGAWRQRVQNHLYDLVHRNYSLSIIDPDDILGGTYMVGGSRNLQQWEDPDFTALVEKQRRIGDRVERRKVLKQIEDYTRGEIEGKMPGPWMQTIWGKWIVWPVHKSIQNFRPCFSLQQCMHFDHLWLTEEGISKFK